MFFSVLCDKSSWYSTCLHCFHNSMWSSCISQQNKFILAMLYTGDCRVTWTVVASASRDTLATSSERPHTIVKHTLATSSERPHTIVLGFWLWMFRICRFKIKAFLSYLIHHDLKKKHSDLVDCYGICVTNDHGYVTLT
jgi:hypothetical protein